MTVIECPACKAKVDIDKPTIIKEEDGLDLKVVCPKCETQFVVERIKELRPKLLKAQFAYVKQKDGTTAKIHI